MKNNFEKLSERLQGDQAFAEKLMTKETPEEAQAFLKGEGLELSMDEIMDFRTVMLEIDRLREDGELSEEDLENVAGGTSKPYTGSYRTLHWAAWPGKAYMDTCFTAGDAMYRVTHFRVSVRSVFRGW